MCEPEATVGKILPQPLRLQDTMVCERRVTDTCTKDKSVIDDTVGKD